MAENQPAVAKAPSRKGDYARLQRALQANDESYTIVLFCSDSYRNRGTRNRAKWQSDNHSRKRSA